MTSRQTAGSRQQTANSKQAAVHTAACSFLQNDLQIVLPIILHIDLRNFLNSFYLVFFYTIPCAFMASTTFLKPAMLAPIT